MKRFLTVALVLTFLGGLVATAQASGIPPEYGWTISDSNTDPFSNSGPVINNIQELYVWYACNSGDGISAAAFELYWMNSGNFVFSFIPAPGILSIGTGGDVVIAVGGCPNAPVLVGKLVVLSSVPDQLLFGTSPVGGCMCAVDCSPAAQEWPIQWIGYSTDGTPPLQDWNACTPTVPLTADAGPGAAICAGGSVMIGGSPTAAGGVPPYMYHWTPVTALDDSVASNPVASPAMTTTYEVRVTDAAGVQDADTVTVVVNPNPVADAGSDVAILVSGSTVLGGSPTGSGGTPPYSYGWSPAAALDDPTAANPTASPVMTTIYTVTVTDSAGCEDTDDVTVTVSEGEPPCYGVSYLEIKRDAGMGSDNSFVKLRAGVNFDDDFDPLTQDLVAVFADSNGDSLVVELGPFEQEGTADRGKFMFNSTVGDPRITAQIDLRDCRFQLMAHKALPELRAFDCCDISTRLVTPGWFVAETVTTTEMQTTLKYSARPEPDCCRPDPPSDLMFVTSTRLRWMAPVNGDVEYFSIYGSDYPTFDGTNLIARTELTAGDVDGTDYAYYHVTSTDYAQKESEAATIPRTATGIGGVDGGPVAFTVEPVRPNPVRPPTGISFDLPAEAVVRLEILDIAGRSVRLLVNGARPAGRNTVSWDGLDNGGNRLASGIYFYRVQAGSFQATRKMTIVR